MFLNFGRKFRDDFIEYIFLSSYMFPRQVLCTHFWTIEQRQKFSAQNLGQRLRHNLQVFRFMQSKAEQLKSDDSLAEPLRTMLGKLGSGLHPTTEEILALNDIFTKAPLGLDSLPYNHLVIYSEKCSFLCK